MTDVERAKAHFFEALDLLDRKDYAAAEIRLRDALRIVPDRISALTNLSAALLRQDKAEEAIEVARRSVTLAPENVEGWLVLGSSLSKERQLDGALTAMDRAVALGPNSAQMWMGRATVLTELKRYDAAIADFETARRLNPAEPELGGLLVSAKMHACDWRNLKDETAALLSDLRNGSAVSNPFMVLAMPSTSADQLACAARYTAREYPVLPPLYRGERYEHPRIRLAYISGDFRQHPLAQLTAGIFEHHDRSRFKTFGVSYGPDDGSELRRRLMRGFDRFIDVAGKSDTDVAELLHREQVDIAVDLGGFTSGGRPHIFSMRPAPVQVSYLGYPGTSGSPVIDYILADEIVIPADQQQHYSEKVIWLPDTYYPNDNLRRIAPEMPTRKAAGLPESGFVFCSFNNSYKITPEVFDVWMRLLREIEGSVVWLMASNPSVPDNLRREAASRGVSPERLVFAPFTPTDEHLARHRLADLFLDTSHYNAHTTACDALWAGLPVLTCTGDTFTSRVATSLLNAVGLSEMAVTSLEKYAGLALHLAQDSAALAAIKSRLAANRDTTALFDTARLTRHLEAAYATMVDRSRSGKSPEPLKIPGTA
jgi:predicted O-linked N-acetylglucosamine transferase (SPINDLY family)